MVDLPISNFQKDIGEKLADKDSLSPLVLLADIPLAPVARRVHLVVKCPSVGEPN